MTAARSESGTGQAAYETGPARGPGCCPHCGHQLAADARTATGTDTRPPTRSAEPSPPSTAELAKHARETQRLAPIGSSRRRAAGVAAIALDGARSIKGARRRLQEHRLPPEVRQAAAELLDVLEHGSDETDNPEQGDAP